MVEIFQHYCQNAKNYSPACSRCPLPWSLQDKLTAHFHCCRTANLLAQQLSTRVHTKLKEGPTFSQSRCCGLGVELVVWLHLGARTALLVGYTAPSLPSSASLFFYNFIPLSVNCCCPLENSSLQNQKHSHWPAGCALRAKQAILRVQINSAVLWQFQGPAKDRPGSASELPPSVDHHMGGQTHFFPTRLWLLSTWRQVLSQKPQTYLSGLPHLIQQLGSHSSELFHWSCTWNIQSYLNYSSSDQKSEVIKCNIIEKLSKLWLTSTCFQIELFQNAVPRIHGAAKAPSKH